MKRSRLIAVLLVMLVSGMLLVGMAAAQDDGQTTEEQIAAGAELFVRKGCVACHGADATGTDIAPALAGHSEFAVRRQIRAPVGIMPVYGPEMISDEELETLVAYITNLEMMEMDDAGDHAHQHEGVALGDIVFAHHWMLWLALESGDVEEALHQTAHTLEHLEGIHLPRMQEVLTALTADDIDAARALIEPMVMNVGTFSDDPETIVLQMVYMAVSAEDVETAEHFLTHYNESTDSEFGDELMQHLEAGELHDMGMLLEERLGDEVTFATGTMAMDMGDHDDADGHDDSDEHNDDDGHDNSDDHDADGHDD